MKAVAMPGALAPKASHHCRAGKPRRVRAAALRGKSSRLNAMNVRGSRDAVSVDLTSIVAR